LVLEKTVTGAVLVGGTSRRFGSPKQDIMIGSERLVDCTERILTQVLGHFFLLIGLSENPDDRPNSGPLGGIETALKCAQGAGYTSVLIAACDMPGIEETMIRMIATHPSTAYVVTPTLDGQLQPLCARWLTSFLPQVQRALDAQELSIHQLLSQTPPYIIQEHELLEKTLSPHQVLANVNTPNDLDRFRNAALK